MWLRLQLNEVLSKRTHILTSAQQFVQRFAGQPLITPCMLIRIDIKKYFMSGTAQQLLKHFRSFLMRHSVGIIDLIMAVASLVLYGQFVESLHYGGIYHIEVGSGMGLVHSGSVLDPFSTTSPKPIR